jgi:hypothetical protein
VVIKRIDSLDNPEFGRISMKTAIGPTGSTVLNLSLVFNQQITVAKCLVILSIPKDKNDQNYENVVIRSSVDMCKMFQGITGNFLTRMVMENIKKIIDFDLKCPIDKVRK